MDSHLLPSKAKLRHGRILAAAFLVLVATFIFTNSASAIKIKLSDEDAKSYGVPEIDTDDLSEIGLWKAGSLLKDKDARALVFFELNRLYYGKIASEQNTTTSSSTTIPPIKNGNSTEQTAEKTPDTESRSKELKEVEELKAKFSSLKQEAEREGVSIYLDEFEKLIARYREAIANNNGSDLERLSAKCKKELKEVQEELELHQQRKREQYNEIKNELRILTQEAECAGVSIDDTQINKFLAQYEDANAVKDGPGDRDSRNRYRDQCRKELNVLRGELLRQTIWPIAKKAKGNGNQYVTTQCGNLLAKYKDGMMLYEFEKVKVEVLSLRIWLLDEELGRNASDAHISGPGEMATKFDKVKQTLLAIRPKLTEKQLKEADADFKVVLEEYGKLEREWREEKVRRFERQRSREWETQQQEEKLRQQLEDQRKERERKNREHEEQMRYLREKEQAERESKRLAREEEERREQARIELEMGLIKREREEEARRQQERKDREREEQVRLRRVHNERELDAIKTELSSLMREANEVGANIDDSFIKHLIGLYTEAIAEPGIHWIKPACEKKLNELRGELFRHIISPAATKANERKGKYSWDGSFMRAEEYNKLITQSNTGLTSSEFNTCKAKSYSLHIKDLISQCSDIRNSFHIDPLGAAYADMDSAFEKVESAYRPFTYAFNVTEKQVADANADFEALLKKLEKAKHEEAEAKARREREAEEQKKRVKEAQEEARLKREAEEKAKREREAEEEARRKRQAEEKDRREREAREKQRRDDEAFRKAQFERDAELKAQFWKDVNKTQDEFWSGAKSSQNQSQAQRERQAKEAREQAERDSKAKEAREQAERERKAREQAEREEQARNNPDWQRAREEREREQQRRAEEKSRFGGDQSSSSQPGANERTTHPAWTKAKPETWEKLTAYEILDIPLDANEKVIKKAYLSLLKIFHPNGVINSDGSDLNSKLSAKITEAYNKLGGGHPWKADDTWSKTGTNYDGADPAGKSHGR